MINLICTYEIIKNYLGEIESKKIISENIIQEPIDEIIENGTSTPNLLFRLFFVLCSILIPIYNLFIYKNSKTLFVKILNKKGNLKIFLFILYFLIIFPLFIDCCIILYDIVIKIKNLKKQKIWYCIYY